MAGENARVSGNTLLVPEICPEVEIECLIDTLVLMTLITISKACVGQIMIELGLAASHFKSRESWTSFFSSNDGLMLYWGPG